RAPSSASPICPRWAGTPPSRRGLPCPRPNCRGDSEHGARRARACDRSAGSSPGRAWHAASRRHRVPTARVDTVSRGRRRAAGVASGREEAADASELRPAPTLGYNLRRPMLSPGTLEPLGGRFALEREVGRGGVGVVYRALDLHTGHPVAVKIVAAAAGVAPEDEARLRREGEVLRLLRHPNIVRVIASGFLEREQQPFVAMEWLEGEDLGVRHRRRPLALQEVVALGALVARALGAAHRAGVVHRDIKPGNILLRPLPDAPP